MKVRLTTSMVSRARPEPGGVDVGVAGEVDLVLLEDAVQWRKDELGFAEAGVEGGLVPCCQRVEVDGGCGVFYG